MQSPYVLSLILCDAVYRDPATGKHSVLGTFSILQAREFPTRHPKLGFYAALTDGRGKVRIRVQLASADEEEPLFALPGEVNFDDPHTVYEIAGEVVNPEFKRPGEYRLQIYADEELLMERRLLVTQRKG